MAINFPASPIEGQIFNASPGLSFVSKGGLWAKALMTTALRWNRIVNPAMQISQEHGNNISATSDTILRYVTDMWQVNVALSAPATMTVQRVQSATPSGSKDRVRMTVVAPNDPLPAGNHVELQQHIEGTRVADFLWGTANAKQVVLRFGWKSPAGTYSISLKNSASNRGYIANFTVAAGQANIDTVQTIVIPGDVTGTWVTNTGLGVSVRICIAAGTSRQGAAGWSAVSQYGTASNTNGIAVAGAVFELFDVGLHTDPYLTGVAPPFVVPDAAIEMRRCQRYWYKGFGFGAIVVNTTQAARGGTRHPVPMRVTPSGAIAGAPRLYDGAATPAISALYSSTPNIYAAEFGFTCSTTFGTGFWSAMQYYQGNDDSYIGISARM